MSDLIERLREMATDSIGAESADEIERLRAENDTLRLIASKIMPCHYCGVDEIAKCPHGFPGCALADDYLMGEDRLSEEIQRLRAENAALRSDLAAAKQVIADIVESEVEPNRIDAERHRALSKVVETFGGNMADVLASLEEAESLRADAERYSYLCDPPDGFDPEPFLLLEDGISDKAELDAVIDAAIDAARKESP